MSAAGRLYVSECECPTCGGVSHLLARVGGSGRVGVSYLDHRFGRCDVKDIVRGDPGVRERLRLFRRWVSEGGALPSVWRERAES